MRNKIHFLKFADVPLPVFKEYKNKGWVNYGADNKYPYLLLELFNKSAKHNAVVLGKANYVHGQGLAYKDGVEGEFIQNPNPYETLHELQRKVELDYEVFNAFCIEVHWNALGQIGAIYHLPFADVRTNADKTQFWVKKWNYYKSEEPRILPAFNPKVPEGVQVYYYREYRPGLDVYPLPTYIGALNAIKTDVEVSKYHLSTITNGMFASKMISFFEGIPTDDEKKEIEKGFKTKFTGSENAGSIVLNFGTDPNKGPRVDDLSGTELDKHFDLLSKYLEQEIFTGHQVTSPMLFGIKSEGQLGGRNEMREAYEIFKNTYISDRQRVIEMVFTEISKWYGDPREMVITPVEPIMPEFSENTLLQIAPKEWLLDKAGIDLSQFSIEEPATAQARMVSDALSNLSPLVANKVLESMTQNEIRALVNLPPTIEQQIPTGDGAEQNSNGTTVNENLKNLTGRQWQNVSRIVRNFEKGKITQEQARLLLKGALGLTDEEVDIMLAIDNENQEFSAADQEAMLLAAFAECGVPKSDYLVVRSRKALSFQDEPNVTQIETDVLDLIRKDKRVTPEVISDVMNIEVEAARGILKRLEDKGVITSKVTRIDGDVIIERSLVRPLSKVTDNKPKTLDFKIMYSYEGPKDNRNRPFCAKMLELDRFYSRAEIEDMSRRLGYSVWDRRGGWWTMPNGERSKSCRHEWRTNIVIKKR